MTSPEATPESCEAVVKFLTDALPPDRERGGWNDMAMTAYQIGCEALVKLGQAERTPWGASPHAAPSLPAILPRWDDLCIAVLWLGDQKKAISFRLPDGQEPPLTIGRMAVTVVGAPPPSPPNIAPAQGLGPARATPEYLTLLEQLGLVGSEMWTPVAQPILWRTQPRNWGMDITPHPLFSAAVDATVDSIPQDIRNEISSLLDITEADVASLIAKSTAMYEEARARYGPKARIGAPYTAERARQGLISRRGNDLDWVFFRKWRLDDLWLSPTEQRRALEIFHDRLGCAMRRAVMTRLYPDLPEFSA